jgi:HPt (histidine-containing phosphotransfer) domain-containing protein
MDLSGLARDLGFDVESVRGLLSRFAEVTEKDLADLERSLAAGDGPAARRIAHQIRGAAASLELQDIARAAAAVETGATAGAAAGLGPEVARIRAGLAAVRHELAQAGF